MPQWLGDTMEKVFSGMVVPVTVTAVHNIAPALKKITMTGNFSKIKYTPGNVVEFRVTDNDYRHYTVSFFDKEKNSCEMLVYLHGLGVGSKWAQNVKEGDVLKLLGPGGKISYKENHENHVVFGDETSLGLMLCLQREALARGDKIYLLAELEEAFSGWPALLHLQADIVSKSAESPAQPAIDKISEGNESFWNQWDTAVFYLTGRAKSIQAFRKALITKGIPMKNIFTEPYWADGKKGL